MKEWFEGKIISVVGNAESLLNNSFGKEIDSAEVVVRINRGGYRFIEFPKQMGTRLDVWCMQNAKQNRNFFDKPHTKTVLKMQMDTIDISPSFVNEVDCVFDTKDRKKLESDLPKKASTGLRVLYYIKNQLPSKVLVYGFDWKETFSWHEKRVCIAHDFKAEKEYCAKNFFDTDIFELRL